MDFFRPKSAVMAATLLALTTPLMPAAAQQAANTDAEQNMRIPELPPAYFDETLAIGGDEIDARKARSRMTVEVQINETGPHRFVVDSGADTSVIGTRLAGRLGLPDADRVMLHAMTESTVVDRVEVDTLQLGPSMFSALDLPVLDEYDIGGDGMIGLDALVEKRLMMDFEKRVITVDDSFDRDRSASLGRGEIIVTGRLQRGQLILTEVKAENQRIDAVVDTGTEITIGNSKMRELLFKRKPKDTTEAEIFGVTGAKAIVEIAVIKRLRLGPVLLRNVPIAFADVPPFEVFGINDKPSLLLGTDVLENFRRVSLDFGERKVRFQLRKCKSRLVSFRTTAGIATRIGTDTDSACLR